MSYFRVVSLDVAVSLKGLVDAAFTPAGEDTADICAVLECAPPRYVVLCPVACDARLQQLATQFSVNIWPLTEAEYAAAAGPDAISVDLDGTP